MADDKIYFDEQALSIVDSWLSGNDNESKSAKRLATSSTIAPASKVGLGFKGKVAAEKTKDALQIRLEKSQKKKKNSEPEDEPIATKVATGSSKNKSDDDNDDDDDDDDEGVQLHGVVEDMPISRTQKSIKPVAVVRKQQPKRKAELINGNLVCEKKEISPPVVVAPIESISKPSASSSFKTPGTENEYKRKRTKTRSKQKNIRRDNRSDSQKPSYITDTQSEDYRGRYLTEVRIFLPHPTLYYLILSFLPFLSRIFRIVMSLLLIITCPYLTCSVNKTIIVFKLISVSFYSTMILIVLMILIFHYASFFRKLYRDWESKHSCLLLFNSYRITFCFYCYY